MKINDFPSISIVGATGAVGKICLDILNERNYPSEKINLFASSRSAGKKIIYNNNEKNSKFKDRLFRKKFRHK